MTGIDSDADIELRQAGDHVEARMPLAGPVTAGWIQCYQRLASAINVPAQAQSGADRAWLVVRVPAVSSPREVTDALDAARDLITEADGATAASARAMQSDAVIRDWWDHSTRGARRGPMARVEVVRTSVGAERRWTLALALLLATVILLLLPTRFSFGSKWTVPAIEIVLVAGILAAGRSRSAARAAMVRALSYCLVLLLVTVAALVTVRLVIDLVHGGPETNSASDLLRVGGGVWFYTIIAFAFLYWVLDGGGPAARIWEPRRFPDLAFPQLLNPQVARPGWRPRFSDYLYLGFTNATAFSPTDVMPIARWSKLAMTVQAVGSLLVLGLVIARAVNIFK